MAEKRSSENGITPTVKTFFSRYTPGDIINCIGAGKVNAVFQWLNEHGLHPEKSLVIGSYLTGARIANHLGKISSVTVLDIYPHLQHVLDPEVSFTTDIHELDTGGWDFIMDTSGLGGINPDDLLRLDPPQAFLVEDPGSDGSDHILTNINQSRKLLRTVRAPKSGILCTTGLHTKTSGTMTLTMEVLCRSMREASREEGVLYSTASMEFYERILFQDKDLDAYLERLKKPALVVSSLRDIDCDRIIERNLSALRSQVENCGGEDHESLPIFQKN